MFIAFLSQTREGDRFQIASVRSGLRQRLIVGQDTYSCVLIETDGPRGGLHRQPLGLEQSGLISMLASTLGNLKLGR
jgi:hypothetical protein